MLPDPSEAGARRPARVAPERAKNSESGGSTTETDLIAAICAIIEELLMDAVRRKSLAPPAINVMGTTSF